MAEMLSCPFCGSLPSLEHFAGSFTVYCANYDCLVGVETSATTAADAFEAWNKRAPVVEKSLTAGKAAEGE